VRTQILDWDHNWDEPESPMTVLRDSAARRFVRGVAWHCYAGEVRAQSTVHDAFPDVDTWFTECAGGDWAPDFGANLRWNVRTLIIGATRHWARGVTLWNLALDEQHGPHTGGCTNCRGVLTIDTRTGTVTRNEEFYALAHASRFVRPGAVRIGAESSNDSVAVVAFRHPDDQTSALIAVNDAPAARTVQVRIGNRRFALPVPAGGVATAVWR
jgi:glucosylceramidase